MSGIGIAAASGVTAGGGGGGPPLSVSLSWTGGTPTAVTGASGVPASAVLVQIASGGTPPYVTETITLTSNPSGKLFITGAPDNVHNTIGWSGFALNETESFTARYSVTDSVGATKSASVSSSIRRTN